MMLIKTSNLIKGFNRHRTDIVEVGMGNQKKIKKIQEDKRMGD